MLAEERFALILDLLARQRTATVQELCEALNASESTIRRDLNELDKQGKLNKVHGGATLPDSPFRTDEPTMAAKEELAVSQKQSIAQAAAELILPEDFIYLDAGSSTLALARALSGPALNASYVTNGVAHARLLAQKGCRVFLPGGLLRPQTEAIIGAAALTAIQQYNFTKAFMGANGVALGSGFTTPDPEEAAVKAAALHRARETWFLVDDTKFAQVYPAVICDLHSGAILTNRCPNPKYRQYTLIKETEGADTPPVTPRSWRPFWRGACGQAFRLPRGQLQRARLWVCGPAWRVLLRVRQQLLPWASGRAWPEPF